MKFYICLLYVFQVTKLFNRYKMFYMSWHKHRKEQEMLESGNLADMSMSIMEIAGNLDNDQEDTTSGNLLEPGKYSQRQAEFFIAKQSTLLQHNELGAMVPKKLQQRISELLRSNPDLAEAHYLSYMNYLRVHEYCAAMDSLYHYYDRHQPGGNTSKQFSAITKTKLDEDVFCKSLRYAALNLAALHHKFGHRLEALAAVKEAITIAQESNDHVCLQHALGWLQRLGIQGTGSVAYMLERLVSKATELNLPYLLSLGVQASAKHTALATSQPSHVFEFLLRSDIVNCQHSQSDLMTVSYAQKAALWHLYGKREMCSMNCQLMLHLNTSDQGVFHNSESECIALCQLAQLQAQQGEYDVAFDILNTTKRRFPESSEHSQIWKLNEHRLLFTRAIHQGAWNKAEGAVTNMTSINSLEASYCRCVLLREKGEASSAFDMVQMLVSKCKDKKDQYQEVPELYARLLQLHGDLYCATGNPTLAGQPLLACITLCRDHHFSYNIALATLHLAFIQYNLGMPSQCLTLIESVLCDMLTHGTLYDCARAHFLWVKCKIAAASKVGGDTMHNALLRGVEVMADIISWFRKVEAYSRVKVAVYYLARLYHELGQAALRNQAAYELKRLDEQYPNHDTIVINVL